MKPKCVSRLHLIALALAIPAQAGTYYWDINGTADNVAAAATGAWDGTNAFWNTDSTGGAGGSVSATPGNADDLILSSGSLYTTGTITASGPRAASSISFEDNVALTLAGAVTIGGSGTKSGIFVLTGDDAANSVTGTLTLNGNNTIQKDGTGNLTIGATALSPSINGTGNLEIKNNANAGTISLASTAIGTFAFAGSITNSGTGTGGVNIGGAGTPNALITSSAGITQNSPTSTLTVYGGNTAMTGGVTVNAGTANVVNSNVTGGATGKIILGATTGSAAASVFIGSGAGNASPVTVRAGSSGVKTLGYNSGGGTTMTYSGAFTANDDVTILQGSNNSTFGVVLSGSSISIAANKTMTLKSSNATSSQLTISGPISSADATSKIVLNTGGARLSNANPFSGTVQILNNSGALALNNVNAVQNATLDNGTVAGTQSVTFNVAGTNTYNIGALHGADDLALGANSLSVGSKALATTFGGIISGTGGLTKVGAASLTLSAANTHSGNTTINSGSLVGVVGGSCASSPVSVAATGGNSATLGVSITDNTLQWTCPSLTVNNAGTSSDLNFNFGIVAPSTTVAPLNVTGAADFTTTPAVTVGLQGFNIAAAGTYPLMTYASSTGTAPTAVTITGSPRDTITGHLTVTGAGPFTLNLVIDSLVATQPLSWTGGNGIWDEGNSGNLIWEDSDNAATYYQAGDVVVFNNSVGSGGTVTLNSTVSPVGITVANPMAAYTISGSGAIAGSTALNKSGAAALTLATANTYSGGTTLSDGQLNINNGGSSAANSAIGTGPLTIAAATVIDNTSGSDVTLLPAIIGNWNADFTYAGSANNLNLGTGPVILNDNRQITVSGQTLTVGGIISDGGNTFGLTKAGAGTLSLGGANTFSGGTTINAGKIIASSVGALGTGAVTNDATLDLTAAAVTYTGLSNALSGAGTVNVTLGTGTAATILNGDYSGFTGIWNIGTGAAAGAGKVQMNGVDNSTATINVLANATVFSANTHNAAIVLNGGDTGEALGQLRLTTDAEWAGPVTLAGDISSTDDGHVGTTSGGSISGPIGETGGSRALVKVGAGTIVLNGANTYSGGTVVNAGALTLIGDQTDADGGYAVNLTNSAASTLNLGSADQTTATSIAVASGKTVQVGGSGGTAFQALLAQGADGSLTTVTNNGTLVASRNSSIGVGASATWTQNGGVNIQPVGGYAALLSIANGGTFTYTGATPIQLTQVAAVTSEAKLTVASAGILTTGQPIDYNGSSGTVNGLSRITLTGGGKIVLSANIPQLTTGDAGGLFNLGTDGGVIDTAGFSTTLSTGLTNVTAQTGSLTKQGAGTLILAGASTYTGDTTVSAGTLELAATTGSLKFVPAATTVSNKITGSGTLNLKGVFNIDLTGAVATLGNTWTLVDVGTLAETFDASFSVAGFTESANVWTKLDGVTGNMWKFEESNGLLSYVVAPAASGFASWSDDFGLALADQDPTDDPDNDGMENLLEFVLNGNPSVSDSSILPDLVVTATDFEFTYQRRDDSLAPETTQTFEWGTTLATWADSAVVPAASGSVPPATVTVSPGSPDDLVTDTVKISIPKTEAGGSGKLFGRLKVEKP